MRALPEPRPVGDVPSLRWGILGTGWIAHQFVATVLARTGQRVVAVGSRSAERSREFAGEFGIEQAFGSYEELVGAEVDVIYVATGHLDHLAHATLALEAGKPVLVEKPMTPRVADTEALVALARARGLFCMEAVWTLALPRYDVVRQILESGMLGDIQSVAADMGEYLVDHRRAMDPAQGGGAMNDLGTYPLMFVGWVLPSARVVGATGQRHPSGSFGQFAAVLVDDEQRQAVVQASMVADTPTTAVIARSTARSTAQGRWRCGSATARCSAGRRTASHTWGSTTRPSRWRAASAPG